MRRASGFSITELMVAAGIFSILSITIFSFFRFGTRSFQSANAKQGLQAEALRIAEALQLDLRRSSFTSISVINDSSRETTVDGETVYRDVVNFIGLKQWEKLEDPDNYDLDTNAPLWNRYWTFYATRDPKGSLIKSKIHPNPPPHAPRPFPQDDLERIIYDNPSTNTFDGITPEYVILSKNVHNFAINRPDPTGGRFDISLKLRKKHEKEATEGAQRRLHDYYELQLSIKPENSFPNDF